MRARKLIGLVLVLGSGCVAQRIVPPDRFARPEAPTDLRDLGVRVSDFHVTDRSMMDTDEDVRALRASFVRALQESAHYGQVVAAPDEVSRGLPTLGLDVQISLQEDQYRTILLDILFFYPFCGLLPLTPSWGDATVEITVFVAGTHPRRQVARSRVVAPFSMIFYSWYRTAPIEGAFQRAYESAFADVATQVAGEAANAWTRAAQEPLADPHRALATVSSTTSPDARETFAIDVRSSTTSESSTVSFAHADLPDPAFGGGSAGQNEILSSTTAESSTVGHPRSAQPSPSFGIAAAAEPSSVRIVDETGFHVIVSPRQSRERHWALRYLAELGGLEGAYFEGLASVSSRARTADGRSEKVGSGDARSEGFKVSLFKPPDRTGFFFPPTLGFLSQDITIEGFVEDVPIYELSGSNTIPAVVSDPRTGEVVDPNAPIAYSLRMRSGFIGQQIGLNLVTGTEWLELFGTLRLGLNLFEVRHMDVKLGVAEEEGVSVAFLQSGLVAAQAGFVVPDIHLAFRASVQYEWYLDFDYPAPVDFLAQTEFNPEKQVYERERVFVEGAALGELNWQLSAIVLF